MYINCKRLQYDMCCRSERVVLRVSDAASQRVAGGRSESGGASERVAGRRVSECPRSADFQFWILVSGLVEAVINTIITRLYKNCIRNTAQQESRIDRNIRTRSLQL